MDSQNYALICFFHVVRWRGIQLVFAPRGVALWLCHEVHLGLFQFLSTCGAGPNSSLDLCPLPMFMEWRAKIRRWSEFQIAGI